MLPLPGFRSSFRQVGPLPSRIASSSAGTSLVLNPSSTARLISRGPKASKSRWLSKSSAPFSHETSSRFFPESHESSALLRATFRSSLSLPGSAQELVICWPLRALTMSISPAMPEYHSNIRPSSSRRWGQTVTHRRQNAPPHECEVRKRGDSCAFSWMSPLRTA